MSDRSDDVVGDLRSIDRRLLADNALLAEWTACSAQDSPALIERLEGLGYEVRGRSHADVVAALKRPPTRASREA